MAVRATTCGAMQDRERTAVPIIGDGSVLTLEPPLSEVIRYCSCQQSVDLHVLVLVYPRPTGQLPLVEPERGP